MRYSVFLVQIIQILIQQTFVSQKGRSQNTCILVVIKSAYSVKKIHAHVEQQLCGFIGFCRNDPYLIRKAAMRDVVCPVVQIIIKLTRIGGSVHAAEASGDSNGISYLKFFTFSRFVIYQQFIAMNHQPFRFDVYICDFCSVLLLYASLAESIQFIYMPVGIIIQTQTQHSKQKSGSHYNENPLLIHSGIQNKNSQCRRNRNYDCRYPPADTKRKCTNLSKCYGHGYT